MRRHHHSQIGFGKSFDSFLSIVTKNGLGMLILIAMASTFANVQVLGQARFKRSLGTPMIKSIKSEQGSEQVKIASFECREGKVFPVETAVITQAYSEFFGAIGRGAKAAELAQSYNAMKFANDFYSFEFIAQYNDGTPDAILLAQIQTIPEKRWQKMFQELTPREMAFFHDPLGFKAYYADLKNARAGFGKRPAIRSNHRPSLKSEDLAEALNPDSVFRKRLATVRKEIDVVQLYVWHDSFPFFRDLREWLDKEGYQMSWRPIDRPLVWLAPVAGAFDIQVDR
jgi:hypothetical protein